MEQAHNDGGDAEGPQTSTESTWPEWVIRQGWACVWVQAPTAKAAVDIANSRRRGSTAHADRTPDPTWTWRCSPRLSIRTTQDRVTTRGR